MRDLGPALIIGFFGWLISVNLKPFISDTVFVELCYNFLGSELRFCP